MNYLNVDEKLMFINGSGCFWFWVGWTVTSSVLIRPNQDIKITVKLFLGAKLLYEPVCPSLSYLLTYSFTGETVFLF